MSLFNLRNLVSKEDFANSHEPVNDGVKAVPNASTIAADISKGSTENDTNNPGDAKIIPEKPDTDDVTETQFDTTSETEENTGVKPETNEEAVSPVDAPLDHETKEAAEDELVKTEKVTESLESYNAHANRFDIVGYPKADRERLQKRMNWLARRSGNTTNVKISAESISNLVDKGRERIHHLTKQIELHEKRKVSIENVGEVDVPVTVEPVAETAIGNLDPETAAGITAIEIDPLDVGINAIKQVSDTLEVLHESQITLEKYMQTLKSETFISQQAGAVLQAGLDEIDRKCGLKVRATGMEGYDTSPRSAMLKAKISVESLTKRAADIGAKVIQWIKDLLAKADNLWAKYKSGVSGAIKNARAVQEKVNHLTGKPKENEISVKTTPDMYLGNEFVGNSIHAEVARTPKFLFQQYNWLRVELGNEFNKILSETGGDPLKKLHDILNSNDLKNRQATIDLPGGNKLTKDGAEVKFIHDQGKTVKDHETITLDSRDMRKQMTECVKFLEALEDEKTLDWIKAAQESTAKQLVTFRKNNSGDLDETEIQKVQMFVVNQMSKSFSITTYFETIRYLARQATTCMRINSHLADVWTNGSKQEE